MLMKYILHHNQIKENSINLRRFKGSWDGSFDFQFITKNSNANIR